MEGMGELFLRPYQDHNRLTAVRCLPWLVRRRTLSGGPLITFITTAYTKRGTEPECRSANICLKKKPRTAMSATFCIFSAKCANPTMCFRCRRPLQFDPV